MEQNRDHHLSVHSESARVLRVCVRHRLDLCGGGAVCDGLVGEPQATPTLLCNRHLLQKAVPHFLGERVAAVEGLLEVGGEGGPELS